MNHCEMMDGSGCQKNKVITVKPNEIPEEERDYYLERRYPAFGNLVPRDVASRAAKERCDAGYGVGTIKAGCLSGFILMLINKIWKSRS